MSTHHDGDDSDDDSDDDPDNDISCCSRKF